MASLFNTLGVGYSGLNSAQVGINTTGHNISNAEVEGYTRQRVIQSAATPISTRFGQIGNGTEIQDIKRVFDNFVFDRYTNISSDKEYSDYEKQTLKELSTYFPEVDGVGVKSDLSKFYDMWQTLADNPTNDAIKVALAKQTESLTKHIQQTQGQVLTLQQQVNDQLGMHVNEVNDLAKQLASLNASIDTAEAGNKYTASDLRDKRNVIERNLARLIGAKVKQGQLESNTQIDSNSNTRTGSYTLSVNGFNIVDGATYHPLKLTKDNKYGFYSLSYERQDGTLIPMEEKVTGGKIGAIFALRGGAVDTTTGMPTDGVIQKTVTELDAFAKGLIESTNNLYAQSATTHMQSNNLAVDGAEPLLNSKLNIHQGAFNVVVYDIDGNEIASRKINIDASTTMSGAKGSNSIEGQITDDTKDDNNDGNANNDVDDFLSFNFQTSADGQNLLDLNIKPEKASQGYTFAIKDDLTSSSFASGSNFAGATGVGRFLGGDSARNIHLTQPLQDNPTKIQSGYSSTSGDNRLALDMVQQQFESYKFQVGDQSYDSTMYGMFDTTATDVGIATNNAISKNETITTQFNSTKLQYDSVSKVNIDEEMTNLIKYQTSYGAAAKVITTVDRMMQTLLGIKQ